MSYEDETVDFKLDAYFPYIVRLFYRDVSQTVKDVYTTNFNLSVSEWRTMSVLNNYTRLSAKEIVSKSSMDKVNVSRSVSKLEKRKLLERHVDPTDRRRILLRLTRKGQQIMRELIPLVLNVEKDLLKGLDDQERATLLSLMHKVSLNAHSIQPPTPPHKKG